MSKKNYSEISKYVLDILMKGSRNTSSKTNFYLYLIIITLIKVNVPLRKEDIIDNIEEANEFKICSEKFNKSYFDLALSELIINNIVFSGIGYLEEAKENRLILNRNEYFYIEEINKMIEKLPKLNIFIENKDKKN